MSTIEPLLKELEQEAQTTRKMLERVPTAYFDWQPHKKSMTVQRLCYAYRRAAGLGHHGRHHRRT